jgi:hypothetical protein
MAGVGYEVSGVGTPSNIQHLTPVIILPKNSVPSVVDKTQTREDPHHPLNPRSIAF